MARARGARPTAAERHPHCRAVRMYAHCPRCARVVNCQQRLTRGALVVHARRMRQHSRASLPLGARAQGKHDCLSFSFENAPEIAERKSIFISSRSTMAFQTLAQNSARQRARRIGSDPARINAVRTDPTPHRTDAPVGLVRTRSNRCGPNQSDASSNRCVRRIASGPARIGADRTDSARLGPVRRAGLMRARLGLVRRSH